MDTGNMTCVFIGGDDFLAYDSEVAGLFNNYSVTAAAAIHQIENRRLTDEEVDRLLEELDCLDEDEIEDRLPNLRERGLIDDIQVYYPEIRYIVKALYRINEPDKIVLADQAEAARGRKRLEKKKEKKRDERQTEQDREREAEEELVEKSGSARIEEEKARMKKAEEAKEERKKEEEKKRGGEAEKEEGEEKEDTFDDAEKARREAVEKEEEELKKQGRMQREGEKKYGGWKGLLYDMFQEVKRGDPEKYKEKQKLKRFLRDNWKQFKANEKLLQENEELVDVLRDATEKGVIRAEDIAVFNELIERDPKYLKDLDLQSKTVTLTIPLNKVVDEDRYPNAMKADSEVWEGILESKTFKNRKIQTDKFRGGFKLEGDPEKGGKREIVIDTDIGTAMDTLKKLDLEADDVKITR